MRVTGVRFSGRGKVYSFDAKAFDLKEGDSVIVDTENGAEFGTVAQAVYQLDKPPFPTKAVLRLATQADIERVERSEAQKEGALRVASEKISKHGLDMKLVDAEFSFDGNKVVFYFTAENRVDFRELVKDLASYFRMRIELKQIGIRDECKMLGGIAPCGRPCCCASHLNDFAHVSVKMAKTQGLSLNPTKISGLCGRLMCCLQYENEHYSETARSMPKIGSDVITPDGKGIAVSANMLKNLVRVKVAVKDGYEYKDYDLADLKLTKRMMGGGQQPDTKEEDEPLD